MENLEWRAVIRFLTLQGKGPKVIQDEMMEVYKEYCPSYSTIKFWCAEFKRGRTSLRDDPRSGRPAITITDDVVASVHRVVEENRRVTTHQIARELGISYVTVWKILRHHLLMSKVCAKWVPKLLTREMREARVQKSASLLALYRQNKQEFEETLVTGDETWIRCYDPETKGQSKQWKHCDSPPPKKAKATPSRQKVMATVFWDSKGILLIDFLEKGKTITGTYYTELLIKLKEAIKKKRRGLWTKGVKLLHDNARVHTAKIAVAKAQELKFQILAHPAYSPDLAPSDYWLFPKLKEVLKGQRFSSEKDACNAAERFFEEQTSEFFFERDKSIGPPLGKVRSCRGKLC